MDENLNFMMVNTQSISCVDNVDIPSGKIHDHEGTDGGRR
jgi:hypothetical protein